MAEKILVANWKANKNFEEAISWVEEVGKKLIELQKKVILCPSPVFLIPLAEKIRKLDLSEFLFLGGQDISKYPQGAYTGEVAVSQLKGFIKFSIIGHSERRKYFAESDSDVIFKIKLLLDSQITPILCISNSKQLANYLKKSQIIIKNSQQIIFVYEPPEAISGGGKYCPETPAVANKNAAKISQMIGKRVTTIYGGSINKLNSFSFFSQENIDGGLIGQASLKISDFIKILEDTKKLG